MSGPAEALGAEIALARWLTQFTLGSDDEMALFAGFCQRLVEAGLPLGRATAGSFIAHPLINARSYGWRRGQQVTREEFTRQVTERPAWKTSPLRYMLQAGVDEFRRTLGTSYLEGEFGMVDELIGEGFTDYLAFVVRFGAGTMLGSIPGVILAFQTTEPGGFAGDAVDLLRRGSSYFAHAYKTMASVATGQVLLRTYLGSDPARRVHQGAIERGKAETVNAVLWYSDLAGFTRIADTAPRDQLLGLLNAYADCLVSTIAAHAGEVLKFMGDGILAMFPLAEDRPCGHALDAAEAALHGVDRLNAERRGAGLPWADIHLALHVGEVLYGNIGSQDRLDFTMVGPAVNEVARIEAMCRSLDQRVVTSAEFAAAAGTDRHRLVSLGRYALRGVRRPAELFTMDPEAASAAPALMLAQAGE